MAKEEKDANIQNTPVDTTSTDNSGGSKDSAATNSATTSTSEARKKYRLTDYRHSSFTAEGVTIRHDDGTEVPKSRDKAFRDAAREAGVSVERVEG